VPVDLIWIEVEGATTKIIIGVEFDGATRQWRFHFTGFKPEQGWSWQDGILTEGILEQLLLVACTAPDAWWPRPAEGQDADG
jgi:hypothetical protein